MRTPNGYKVINLGDGPKPHAVYLMPVIDPDNYWGNVTDVSCPICSDGIIRWYEAGYVPGSRLCDGCYRFFQASGSLKTSISLIRDRRFDKTRRQMEIK